MNEQNTKTVKVEDKTVKVEEVEEVKVLSFKDFLEEVEHRDLKTNVNANQVITIQQTQRNALRKELVNSFYNHLIDSGIDAYLTEDGVIIAIENENIGTISIECKMAFKSLDYNPQEEADAYEISCAEKIATKEQKAKKVKV